MTILTVIKRHANGEEVMRYPGELVARTGDMVVVNARFTASDRVFYGMSLKKDDLFVEAYFNDRWYNIYEIYDRDDKKRKGWYCNISRPAIWNDSQVTFEDLALDLLIFPDGKQIVLDEDEFEVLNLDPIENDAARNALAELQDIFSLPDGFEMRRDLIKHEPFA